MFLTSKDATKRITKSTGELSVFPLSEDIANLSINKEKSKEFSEVFTPLWLVDRMIGQVKFGSTNTQTLDLCAGYGQFSVRLMRYLYNTYNDFSIVLFLKNNHAFSELQLSSCYKILNTFGNAISLFIGDSTYLNKLPENAKGIWCYIEKYGYWVCLTKTITHILSPNGTKSPPVSEKKFVESIETVINNLNKTYTTIKDMHNLTLQQMTNTPKLRLELISALNKATEEHSLQNVDTPQTVIEDMLEKVQDIEKKSILVLFNCEIVEHLIHKKKIDPKNITFGVEFAASVKATAIQKMYGVETVLADGKFLGLHSAFKGRKFDVCLSNPPYNRGLDLKILQSLMGNGTIAGSVAKEYVFVHPSTWLLDQKDKTALYGNIKALLTNKLKSVKLFNGNPIFDISLFVPCMITHIDLTHSSNKTDVKFFDETFAVNNIGDITKFSVDWLPVVKPFVLKIEKVIKTSGHIWSHNEKRIDSNKTYCQLSAMMGTAADLRDLKYKGKMVKNDFYTLTRITSTNKGAQSNKLNKPGNPVPTFGFASVMERDNFLEYINTDFARFCLAVLKNNLNVSVGEMELIPWLDFSQRWDDARLFNHFGIDQVTQDYIRKFLPDYYGIRKPSLTVGKINDGHQPQAVAV